ncbi:MAG: phosphoglycerate dehydrogenase [Anaerohalosphaeraceae bacterium]|nr:phosphoglycerate dehydrogenase [Anaerohalosphaeraceae bacterium]
MIKILVADKLATEGVDLLNSMDGVEAVVKTGMTEDELASAIGEYDGVILRSASKITAKVLENHGKFKAVARAGVGVDNIDIPACTRKGVIVMNTPGGNTLSAAEHTLALMLAMSRNVVPACNSLKAGAWDRKKYMGNQLNSKVLGLIGLGRIGLAVAKMALGFNMKVIGFDPLAAPAEAAKLGIEVTDDLEKIYKEADYLSLHVPKNEKTLNMINAAQLKMMKPGMRIVNCARGGIINEDALYDALRDNVIAGAGIDVFPEEPPKNNRFSELDNCVVTPHLGASTEEAQIEVAVEAAQIVVDAIKGGPICNSLNAPASGGSTPAIVTNYAELAKRVGVLMSSLSTGQIKEVQVQYRGEIAELDLAMATTSFQIGLLQRHFEEPINMVNASVMARVRGISVDETKNTESKDVASSFSAKVVTAEATHTITGTVFGENIMRVIEIDGFDVEMTPSDTVMIIYNDDKPGVIGAVGTVCGRHGVNIQTMGVGQKAAESKAILAVSLDAVPNEDMMKEISSLDFVNEVHVCKLED